MIIIIIVGGIGGGMKKLNLIKVYIYFIIKFIKFYFREFKNKYQYWRRIFL
jgi:hypothetical protein